ncbi:FecR domain-containing protein [Pseudomonas urmiensis]|uniref:FecR family protein n=1 Tax=Pseudomonas urmiensis TaxID=2745493 RepID=A0A923JV12_9PSED|nr:FecR family protein [Pseudomonas urmiensis]MBV4534446.1 FecR family protein [Pseudomonas urmiensis]
MPTPERIPAQAQVDQAIDWLVKLRFDEPSARTERQFQQWLASHPHNALAWQRVSTLSDELAGLPSDLSRRTLEGRRRQQISRRDHLKLLAVLAVGGSLGWAAREPLGLPALLADSSTATGERRDVQGSDGSRIQLNTASAIDLRYSADQRLLTLIRGELTLDSNANDKRPFIIDTQLGALSTHDGQLLLRENAQGLLLAVRRGEVTLMPNSAPLRQVHPGQVLQLAASGAIQPALVHGDPWGWTDGVLSVQQMPLSEFTAELSRYRPGLLRCAPEVADLKVSGTYQLADTEQILQLLARSLPLRIDYRTRYWVSIGAA